MDFNDLVSCTTLGGINIRMLFFIFAIIRFSDVSYIQMIDDEFLSLMIRRFIFCYYVTRQHKAFKVGLLRLNKQPTSASLLLPSWIIK
jgi:hypothetical protein